MPSETVSFNVGGRIFQVRRSLLEGFPNTVLARSVSKEWHEGGEPIFIDRDADRFRYCLDFMRDGQVQLMHPESPEALLKELEYYGFENVNPKDIILKFPVIEAMKCLHSAGKEVDDEIREAELGISRAQNKVKCMKLARACFDLYRQNMHNQFTLGGFPEAVRNEVENFEKVDFDLLNDYLKKKFNLQVVMKNWLKVEVNQL